MRFWRCVRADFGVGLPVARKRLGLVAGAVVAVVVFTRLVALAWRYAGPPFNLGSNLAACVGGIVKYDPVRDVHFKFPAAWMLLLMTLFFAPLSYPYRDLMGFGRSVLVSSGGRWPWWLSKCLWVVVTALLGCLCVLCAALIVTCLLGGGLDLALDGKAAVAMGFSPMTEGPYDIVDFFISASCMTCALCLVQLAASLVLKPTLSIVLVSSVLLASAFVHSPLLPGNYLMVARTAVIEQGGTHPLVGMALAGVLAVVSVALGGWRFSRIDCMDKEFEA